MFIPKLLTKMIFSISNFSKNLDTKVNQFSKTIDNLTETDEDEKDEIVKEVKDEMMKELENSEADLDKRIFIKYCNPKTRVENPIVSHWIGDVPVFHETSERYKLLNEINKMSISIRSTNTSKEIRESGPYPKGTALKKIPNGLEENGIIYYDGYARPDINDTPEAEEIITRRKKYENKKNVKKDSKKKKAKERLIDKFGVENAEKIIDFLNKTSFLEPFTKTPKTQFSVKTQFWNEASPWLGMTKEMLEECLYSPQKVDQTVTKNIVREYFYYDEYKTRQKNNAYRFRIVLENDVVVGWKNLV